MTETSISRKFEGELAGDWFVIVVRLEGYEPHARLYVRTDEEVRKARAMLTEVDGK